MGQRAKSKPKGKKKKKGRTWADGGSEPAGGSTALVRQGSAQLARERSAEERATRQRALEAEVVEDRRANALDETLSAVQNEMAALRATMQVRALLHCTFLAARNVASCTAAGALTQQPACTSQPAGREPAPEPQPAGPAEFRKFEKFGNASVGEVIKLRATGGGLVAAEEEWVATEKVDVATRADAATRCNPVVGVPIGKGNGAPSRSTVHSNVFANRSTVRTSASSTTGSSGRPGRGTSSCRSAKPRRPPVPTSTGTSRW